MGELWEVLQRHFPEFVAGFFVTCRLVVVSFAIAMVVGTAVAAFRVAPFKSLNRIGGIYVETFRNVPLLVLIFILYFGFPEQLTPGPWIVSTSALGLYTAAYVAEALRSGVFAVGKGQLDASLSLGFTYGRSLRRIVLPQAFRTVIPPLASLTIAMIKNSAVVGASPLGIEDLLKTARQINSLTFQTHEVFFWSAAGYLLLTGLATVGFRRLETRLAIKR